MNWTLVTTLAVPGLMMGLLSIKGHTRGIEPWLWIILALFATVVIARTAGQRFFLHGLGVGVTWGVLNGLVAATFFPLYAQHNPEVMQRFAAASSGPAPRLMFLASALPIGLVTGVVLGGLCLAASHLIRPAPGLGG